MNLTILVLEIELFDKEVQTDSCRLDFEVESFAPKDNNTPIAPPRSLEECLKIYQSDLGASGLTDDEVILLVKNKHIAAYQVEKAVDNPERGVGIRRKMIGASGNFSHALADLPYKDYDYSKVSCKKLLVIYSLSVYEHVECNFKNITKINCIQLFYLFPDKGETIRELSTVFFKLHNISVGGDRVKRSLILYFVTSNVSNFL